MQRFVPHLVLGLFLSTATLWADPMGSVVPSIILRGDGVSIGERPPLRNPFGVWVSRDGSVYIADTSLQRVRVVSPDGAVRTIAGTGIYGKSSEGGRALESRLSNPTDIAVDAEGSVYIADTESHVVRKITPSGSLIRYVGVGFPGDAVDVEAALHTALNTPTGLYVDAARNLFIADQGNNRVLRVAVSGAVSVVAGNGHSGYSGDGGPARQASLNQPSDIWVSHDGVVTIADRGNHRIRQVGGNGIIQTVAGTGVGGYAGDGHSALNAQIQAPWSVAVDTAGRLLIADTGNGVIRLVDPNGDIFTVSLPAPEDAEHSRPYGLFVERSGAVVFAEADHHIVRRLPPAARSIQLSTGQSVVPADDRTPATVEVSAPGSVWGARIVAGDARLHSPLLDGVELFSNTPGRVVVEISGPETWPLSLDLEYRPTGALSLAWERDAFIANGSDRAVLRIDYEGVNEEEEAVVSIRDPRGWVSRESVVIQGGKAEFALLATAAGAYQLEVKTAGAAAVTSSIIATVPALWEHPDAHEPNDTAETAALLSGRMAGTLHSPRDVDWLAVRVREGYTTQVSVRSKAEIHIGRGPGSGVPGVLTLGPEFGQANPGREILVPIFVQSTASATSAYELDVTHQRVSAFALAGSGIIQANGQDQIITMNLLDHRGNFDAADDSTEVSVRYLSGPVSIEALASRLSGGQLDVRVEANSPGDFAFEVSGEGLGDPVILHGTARSGAHLDLNPLQGDQQSIAHPGEIGTNVAVDVYSDHTLQDTRGAHFKVVYDETTLAFLRLEDGDAYSGAEAIVSVADGVVNVSVVFLEGTVSLDTRWVGRLVFLAIAETPNSVIRLEEAAIGTADGDIVPLLIGDLSVAGVSIDRPLQLDRLAELMGITNVDTRFDSRYDLDSDGVIGFSDFLLFAARRAK